MEALKHLAAVELSTCLGGAELSASLGGAELIWREDLDAAPSLSSEA